MILLNAHGILANPEIRILADGDRKLFEAHRTDATDELQIAFFCSFPASTALGNTAGFKGARV